MALGELDAAIAILEGAQARQPDHAVLLARLAWCRLQLGRRDQALALYRRSLSVQPLMAVYHNLLRLHRDNGCLSEMATCLDAAWRFWATERANWPDDQHHVHTQQLQGMQLDLWLAQERFEAADGWVAEQHGMLSEDEWCALVSGLAQRLAARDRHVQAEDWLRIGLRNHPERLELYDQLAQVAQLQGRTHQAVTLLRLAVHLANASRRPTELLLIRLAKTALQSNPGLAREAAERARDQVAGLAEHACRRDELTDLRLQVEAVLAGVESEEENYLAAEQRYRRALEQHPDSIGALEGLGRLWMKLGRIDEAVSLFKRVEAIDPLRGHGALINARHVPDDVATLGRIEELARTPGMEGSVRTSLLFQLAAAWEKHADHEKAFALAEEANVASRRFLRYEPKGHRQYCARVRHAFPKALYEHRRGCGHESALPVFVVGMPRSGTTLVEQIIAGHSRIHGAGELSTIPRVIARLEAWERYTGSGRSYPDCVDDLDPKVTRGIAERVLQELREYAPEADHVVDKLPHNFENVGLIKLLFPKAKVISVRRDPRDVGVSNYFTDYAGKHGAMGFAYNLEWIGEQIADHDLLMHHWRQVFPGEILEIRYEDVLDDPVAIARRMLDYIGVDWEPEVLDFNTLERPIMTASVWQVRQPLYASSKGRWQRYREYLSPLIAGVNRRISWDQIRMVTLPEPGWLNMGVDCYRQADLDAAEYRFKQLLNCLPQHAAARFMLGLIYVRKGHRDDGIRLMEQAVERCPWNGRWRNDLARAYRMEGRDRDAVSLTDFRDDQAGPPQAGRAGKVHPARLDHVLLSGESPCRSSGFTFVGAAC